MQEFDIERVNRIYLEFEQLAHRVERSSTHYLVLGVESGARLEEVKQAYRMAVSLILPIYSGRHRSTEPDSQAKAGRVLRKTSNAFSVLSNFGKRIEYDNRLFKKRPGLIPISPPAAPTGQLSNASAAEPAAKVARLQEATEAPHNTAALAAAAGFNQNPVAAAPVVVGVSQSWVNSLKRDRRRAERFDLSIPVIIGCHDRVNGQWDGTAQTVDVSRIGARVRTNLNLRHGVVVQLRFDLPVNLRSHGLTEPIFSVYAIARRIGALEGGSRNIGFEFLGEKPPAGYAERPWASYRTDSWNGVERRREERVERSEVVSVKYLDESQTPVRQEIALTENISLSGAMIFVKGAPPDMEFIRLANLTHSFESLSRICDRYIGDDGLERICLQFMERKWPLE
jgi:hypothetical protein